MNMNSSLNQTAWEVADRIIVGIDEVGRGCWAGPLVAGAVALGQPITGLRDSKKLSKKQREALATIITQSAKGVGIGWVSPAEVDAMGLTVAVRTAMLRAVECIRVDYHDIVIDGSINYFSDVPFLASKRIQAVVRADDSVPAVSAASIMAKVARDTYMAEIAMQYPNYGFEKHVGYGTQLHAQALRAHGACGIHRRSYKPVQRYGGIVI